MQNNVTLNTSSCSILELVGERCGEPFPFLSPLSPTNLKTCAIKIVWCEWGESILQNLKIISYFTMDCLTFLYNLHT